MLDPDEFYILASAEAVTVEPDEAEIWRSAGLAAEASSLGPWQARLTRSDAE